MAGIIGLLGEVPFVCAADKVLTFKDLTVENSTKWAQHDVINQKPVLEYVGEELREVSLKIRLDSNLNVSPSLGIQALNAIRKRHKAVPLLIGGEYFGRFVIESLSEDRKYHTGVGVCQIAEVTLTLKEHASGISLF
jgi:hypothetical protein